MQITLKLNGQLTDTGEQIDVLAKACGHYTSDEMLISSLDYEHETIGYVIKEYGRNQHENDFLAILNAKKELLRSDDIFDPFEPAVIEDIIAKFNKSKLLLGAFLALEYPHAFDLMLDNYIKAEEEKAKTESWEHDTPLCKDVQGALDSRAKDDYHEWLYGDYSNWQGILAEASHKLVDEWDCIKYDQKKDVLTLIIPDEMIDELKENGDIEHKTKKELAAYYNSTINYWCEAQLAKEQTARQEQKETRQKTNEYKKQQQEEADKERQAKLLKMKKTT